MDRRVRSFEHTGSSDRADAVNARKAQRTARHRTWQTAAGRLRKERRLLSEDHRSCPIRRARSLPCRSAPGDRPHRRGDAPAADGARHDHRPADRRRRRPPRVRLRLPARPRGLDDAGARRASRGAAAARHGGGHLAGDHRAPSPMSRRRYSVHADISGGDAPMRDSARFHFGFTVPYVTHPSAAAVIEAVASSRGDLGIFRLDQGATSGAWWRTLAGQAPPEDHRAPALHRAARTIRPAPRSSSSRSPWPMRPCATWCSMPPSSSAGTRAPARPCAGSAARWWRAPATPTASPCSSPCRARVEPADAQGRADQGGREPRRSSSRSAAMPNVSA